jgi:hypothetical protein
MVPQNVTGGRIQTAVKTKAKKTNNLNQASFGGSLLKANRDMEVEAAIQPLGHDRYAQRLQLCIVFDCWVCLRGFETLCRLCTPQTKCAKYA